MGAELMAYRRDVTASIGAHATARAPSATATAAGRDPTSGTHPAVVETAALAKSFGDVQAVRGVDLSVPARSIFGFLGLNGAGKTTTIKMLVGLLRPTAGTATVLGRDAATQSLALRRRIGSCRSSRCSTTT
jgi:ABC-2 type transport system ATP-binding protein